jgi:hypothetical protein
VKDVGVADADLVFLRFVNPLWNVIVFAFAMRVNLAKG